ncbi:S41 family peptidase [Pseudotenacibaculum sp. MALMAid0570]|uniref:S41 family peptidase n=1 Tax=Pseudotenacibaculum sp. MALMAid0570 TaxID=3143938 RepID=UPI0032E05354
MRRVNTTIKIAAILFIALISSCEKSERFTATGNDEIHLFIWRGMNNYYLWQQNVADLDDNRFDNVGQVYSHYSDFSSPADVFQSLRYQPGVIDRFSWIVDDYIALENSFQGINQSNGMEYGLVRYDNNPQNVFGYVRYVVPNSDAEAKNVTRGMLFNQVDGTQLTETNFSSLLGQDNYTISLADYNSGNPSANGNSISLTKSQLQENPVAIAKTIIDGSARIGYIMYNQFASSYDGELNAAIAQLKADNITDLIIDLRYNGGGSVRTATYLGGMVTGQFDGQLYSRQIWNSKVQNAVDPSNFINNFTNEILNRDRDGNIILQEPINNLNLTRVYFITTRSSASASELVMNSLSPYIDVKSVGTTTIGKVHGSVTLYDSDNFTREGANLNPNHTWAMQPLVLEIQNRDNQNHPSGIVPDINLPEDYENLGILGERSDPLLDRTIVYILTGAKGNFSTKKSMIEHQEISNSKMANPASNNMYTNFK